MLARKSVFICAPYAGNVNENIMTAIKISRDFWNAGYLPLCPHTAAAFFAEDEERDKALDYCLNLLSGADYIYIHNCAISVGMRGEIEYARATGKKKLYFEKGMVIG